MYLLSAVLSFLAALAQAINGVVIVGNDPGMSFVHFVLASVCLFLGTYLVKHWKAERREVNRGDKNSPD